MPIYPGVERFAGTPRELVARLGDASHVYADGANVISQFFAANLIDDVTGGQGEHRLELTKQLSWPSGLVQQRYRVVTPT